MHYMATDTNKSSSFSAEDIQQTVQDIHDEYNTFSESIFDVTFIEYCTLKLETYRELCPEAFQRKDMNLVRHLMRNAVAVTVILDIPLPLELRAVLRSC